MPLRDDLLKPIPGDNPSGASIRYDPIFEKIKEARREDLDVPQGVWATAVKTADHGQVIKLSNDVLSKRSKDLQIAVWLAEALIKKEGFSQLGPCFTFLHNLLEQFWDTLYPELEDGDPELRAGPLDFIGNKLDIPLRQLPITSNKLSWAQYQESRSVGYETDADTYEKQQQRQTRIAANKLTAEQMDEAIAATSMSFYATTLTALNDGSAALDSLREFCDERFGDDGPSFTGTRKALEDIAQIVEVILRKRGGAVPVRRTDDEEESAEPEEEAETAGPAFSAVEETASFSFDGAASVTNSAATAVAEAPSSDDFSFASSNGVSSNGDVSAVVQSIEPQSDEDVVRQLTAVCRYLITKDLADPAPYMIIRGYRWGQLRYTAPVLDKSKLEPPPTDVRIELKRLFTNRDWVQMLPAAEAAMALPCGRGWLDVQRYVIWGLEDRGFFSAAQSIRSNLKALLTELPDLLESNLTDDTPVANSETRDWIKENVLTDRLQLGFTPPPEPTSDNSSSGDSSDLFSSDTSSDVSSDSSSDTGLDVASDASAATEASAPEPSLELPPLDENPPILTDEPVEKSDEPRDIFEIAMESVQSGNTADGLQMISTKLANERSERARFKRRTQMAHLLLMGGHQKIAEPMLDQLAVEIQERRLEDWEEGPVIAYPLELLLRCVAANQEQVDKRTELYARICKLDPVRALNYTLQNA